MINSGTISDNALLVSVKGVGGYAVRLSRNYDKLRVGIVPSSLMNIKHKVESEVSTAAGCATLHEQTSRESNPTTRVSNTKKEREKANAMPKLDLSLCWCLLDIEMAAT